MNEILDASLLACDLSVALAARYAALLNGWDGEPDPKFEEKLRLLRSLNRDIALLQRTMQRASQQNKELEKELDASEKQEFEEHKQKTLNLLWSVPKSEVLGNGELGRRLAEMITAIQDDLPLPEAKEEGGRRRGRSRSKGSMRSKTDGSGQTESNQLKKRGIRIRIDCRGHGAIFSKAAMRCSTAFLMIVARATAVSLVSPRKASMRVLSAAATSPLRSRKGRVTSTALPSLR
jgi:hypothetical protein